jgi:polar amino acid transport system substrate-binding protein
MDRTIRVLGRRLRILAIVLMLLGCAICFHSPVWAQANEVAPTGTLRTTFLSTNMVQGHFDPATGVTTGVIADITKAMARELGVPYEIFAAPNAAEIVKRLNARESDIGFFAADPERAKEVDFSRPYAQMFNAYVVPAQSKIEKSSDLDQKGMTIAAIKGQTQVVAIGKMVKNAEVVPFDHKLSQKELETMFSEGKINAYGPNRQDAETIAEASHGVLRVLNDNFLIVDQDLVVTKPDAAKLPVINKLLTKVIKDGVVQEALARQGIRGVAVAAVDGSEPNATAPAQPH